MSKIVTIAIKSTTHKRLAQMKLDYSYKSFDKLLNELIELQDIVNTDYSKDNNVPTNSLNAIQNGELP